MSIGSVSNFWMNGRPSGLPENIEDQLADVRRQQRVEPITEDIEEAKSLKKTLGNFNSGLSQLVQAIDPLASAQSFETKTATSSQETVVEVSADSKAVHGSYDISVTGLAQAHTHSLGVDSGLDDPDDASLIAEDMQVSFFHKGQEHTYATDGETTLSSLAESINQDDNGVRATVNNTGTEDAPEYSLILKSESTGAGSNRITRDGDEANVGVQITDTLENGRTNLFEVGTFEQAETQAGTNAVFSVDGVQYERAGKEISDVIQGVMFELKAAGSSTVQIEQDTQAVVSRVEKFVKMYNSVRGYIDEKTGYDKENDKAGALMGSSLANGVERKLANLIQMPVSNEGAYSYLSEVGISVQRDGSLELDREAFTQALSEDAQGVQNMFAGENGVAKQLKTSLTAYTQTYDGLIPSRIDSIDQQITRLQDQRDDAQEGVQRYLERTVAKFTAMENAIMQYQSMQDSIDSMTETWKAMNK